MAAMHLNPILWKLDAHSKDVKAVAVIGPGRFATAGRDRLVKLWQIEGQGSLSQLQSLECHSGFVNSLCYLQQAAVEELEDGACDLLVSGDSDAVISVNRMDQASNATSLATLIAHEKNVCRLRPLAAPWLFASASWDGTVRVWTGELNPVGSLKLAVPEDASVCWSVTGRGDLFCTAHSDRSLKLWRADQLCHIQANAHDDVIRDVLFVSDSLIASVSNDGSLKVWEVALSLKQELLLQCVFAAADVHLGAFIYSAALHAGVLAICGEDGWLSCWRVKVPERQLELLAKSRVPMQSVWSCDFLSTGQVVCVGSGGAVFVFDLALAAASPLAEYRALLQVFEAGENDPDELEKLAQPLSALGTPGLHAGQNLIVRDGDAYAAYQWTGTEWQSMGEVVSRAAPAKARCSADDRMYDYVFKVEMEAPEGGLRFYELPVNRGENPYTAAQRFLSSHDLHVSFLDQVAQFIIKNTEREPKHPQMLGVEGQQPQAQSENDTPTWLVPNWPMPPYKVRAINWPGLESKLYEVAPELRGRLDREAIPEPETVMLLIALLKEKPVNQIFPILDAMRHWVLLPNAEKSALRTEIDLLLPDMVDRLLSCDFSEKSTIAAMTMLLRLGCNLANVGEAVVASLTGGVMSLPAFSNSPWLDLCLGMVFNFVGGNGAAGEQLGVALSIQLLQNADPSKFGPESCSLIYGIVKGCTNRPIPLAASMKATIAQLQLPAQQKPHATALLASIADCL